MAYSLSLYIYATSNVETLQLIEIQIQQEQR